VKRGVLLGTKLVAAAMSLAVVLGSFYVWNTWTQFKASIPHGSAVAPVAAGHKDIDGKAQNILLLGNDSRAGATPAELAALGTADDGGSANTDTMMIMHIPANGSKASVVSFPRDSYVSIPGHGMNKLNAAYPDGYNAAKGNGASEIAAQSAGIQLLSQTLGQLTGLHIDHYVQVNLLGFYRISNAIGGVPVVLCQAQQEPKSGIDLPAGLSKIQGKQALAFVRQRYDVPGSDLGRIKRQQYFLSSVFHKLTSSGTLLNPLSVQKLLTAVSSSLLTDPTLDLLGLADEFAQLSEGSLTFQTIPTQGFANNDAGSVVVVSPAQVQQFVNSLLGIAADPNLAAARPVAPATVTVNVLNAGTENGAATRNADQLKTAGFRIGTVGDGSSAATTVIEYPNGMQSQAKTVALQIPSAQLVESTSVQAVTLVLGNDGLQVNGLPGAKPVATGSVKATTPAKVIPIGTGVPKVPNQPGCIA
jgi:LCP family protein required for cell wall assembly